MDAVTGLVIAVLVGGALAVAIIAFDRRRGTAHAGPRLPFGQGLAVTIFAFVVIAAWILWPR